MSGSARVRALHLSDLHLTDGPRLADQVAVLEEIVAHGRANQVDVWLLTGDLTGRSVPHRATPAERLALYGALARMCAVAPVVIVPGNHDEARDLAAAAHVGVSVPGDGCWPVYVLDEAGDREIETPAGPLHLYWLAYPTKRWLLRGLDVRGLRETQAAVERRLNELVGAWGLAELARQSDPAACPSVFLAHVAVIGAQTSGGEVLSSQEIGLSSAAIEALMSAGVSYGALGHLHLRQEVATRAWYVGSPWRTDFGEREPCKVVHQVELIGQRSVVEPIETGCTWFESLEYRWAASGDGDEAARPSEQVAGWTRRPSAEALSRVVGAEVRARLTVPQQHVASCPWQAELDRLLALGAKRVIGERVVEPVLRVREPTVARATTLPSKLGAYWQTLGTEVPEGDQAAALELLSRLETMTDEDLEALPV